MIKVNGIKDVMDHLRFTNDFWAVLLPCILMGLDVVTGFVNAWAKHEVKSAVMRQGLARKFGELVIIGIAQLFLHAVGLPTSAVYGASFYIALMETISICENLTKLGVPIPAFIRKALHTASDKISGEEDEEDDGKERSGEAADS